VLTAFNSRMREVDAAEECRDILHFKSFTQCGSLMMEVAFSSWEHRYDN